VGGGTPGGQLYVLPSAAGEANLPHPPLLLTGSELEYIMAGMELDEGAAWTDAGLVSVDELQLKEDLEVLEWHPNTSPRGRGRPS